MLRNLFSRFSSVVFSVVMVWMVMCRLKVCRLCLFILWLVKVVCVWLRMVCILLMDWFIISECVLLSVWWIFFLFGILFMLVLLVLLVRMMILCVKYGLCVFERFKSMLLCLVIGMMCMLVMCGVFLCWDGDDVGDDVVVGFWVMVGFFWKWKWLECKLVVVLNLNWMYGSGINFNC